MTGNMKLDALYETAEKLFFRYGVKRVTVEEICRTSGVSKVTFYKHFRNKMELAELIGSRLVDTGFAEFDRIDALNISFQEKIEKMTEWKVKFFSGMHSEFIREMYSLEDLKTESRKRFLANMEKARNRGEIREDIDPAFLWLINEKLGEIITEGSWRGVCSDYGSFQRQMRGLVFFGLLTGKGEKFNREE